MKPKSIILHGQRIEVKFCSPEDWKPRGLGLCNGATARITIKDNLPPDQQAAILLHETIHMIGDMNGLDEVPEVTVAVLANSIFGFLRDNPQVADWICGRKPFSDAVMDAISEAQQQRNA